MALARVGSIPISPLSELKCTFVGSIGSSNKLEALVFFVLLLVDEIFLLIKLKCECGSCGQLKDRILKLHTHTSKLEAELAASQQVC